MKLWTDAEICADAVARDVAERCVYIAECAGEPAGTWKLQLSDTEIWPEFPQEEATYIHRFAVRREFSGGETSARDAGVGRRTNARAGPPARAPRMRSLAPAPAKRSTNAAASASTARSKPAVFCWQGRDEGGRLGVQRITK